MTLTPGSPEAIAAGCLCKQCEKRIYDSDSYTVGGWGNYTAEMVWQRNDCPIHCEKKEAEMDRNLNVIAYHIGRATACWKHKPKGPLDTDQAAQIARDLHFELFGNPKQSLEAQRDALAQALQGLIDASPGDMWSTSWECALKDAHEALKEAQS